MNHQVIDMHVHSNKSDGRESVAEVFAAAAAAGAALQSGAAAGAVGVAGAPALGSWMMLPDLTSPATQTVLPMNDSLYGATHVELDRLARQVRRGKRKIAMQPREFRLLEYLMLHAGEVVTRTMLLENVWDYHFDPQTNVIDVHISRLRAKIDKGFEDEPLLQTVRGAGYMIRAH